MYAEILNALMGFYVTTSLSVLVFVIVRFYMGLTPEFGMDMALPFIFSTIALSFLFLWAVTVVWVDCIRRQLDYIDRRILDKELYSSVPVVEAEEALQNA